MSIEKVITLKVTGNPGTFSLNSDIKDIRKLSLKYFKMTQLDLANVPEFLGLSLRGIPGLQQNRGISSGVPGLPNDAIPLYFKPEVVVSSGGKYSISGKQHDDVTWEVKNSPSTNMTSGEIYLYDNQGQLYSPVVRFYLIFSVSYSSPNYLDPDWKTSRLIQNHLNG